MKHVFNFYHLLGIICIAAVLMPTFAKSGVTNSADHAFHLARIESLARSLQSGVFPAKVRPCLAHTYGYGVGFFYPDLFLYLPAFLMLLGISLEAAYKIYLLFVLTVCWFLTFYSVKRLSKNDLGAAVSAISIVLLPILMKNIYQIGNISCCTAMAFVPAAVCGFLLILQQQGGRLLFMAGMMGTLLSHSTTFLILMFTLAIIFLAFIGKIVRHRKIFFEILKVCLISVLCSAAYWLPALEQTEHLTFKAQTFHVFRTQDGVVSYYGAFVGEYQIAALLLFSVVVFLLAGAVYHSWNANIGVLIFVILLENFIMSSHWFWNTFGDALEFLQFPMRIMVISRSLTGIAAGLSVAQIISLSGKRIHEDKKVKYSLLSIFSLAMMICCIYENRYDYLRDTEKLVGRIYTDEVMGLSSGEEWLPSQCSSEALTEPLVSLDPEGNGAEGVKHDSGKFYDVYVDMSKPYYTVPYIYYYGYRAYQLDKNGNIIRELTTEMSDYNSLVRVDIPENSSGIGHILLTYRKTSMQKISYLMSFLSIAVFAVIYLVLNKKRTGQKVR